MRPFRSVAPVVLFALLATLASSALERTRYQVQDWDCPPPPESCARPVKVLGFPFPYISDYHGISPGGTASLSGALLGMDLFHFGPFLQNLLLYGALLAAVRLGLKSRLARSGRLPGTSARNAAPGAPVGPAGFGDDKL